MVLLLVLSNAKEAASRSTIRQVVKATAFALRPTQRTLHATASSITPRHTQIRESSSSAESMEVDLIDPAHLGPIPLPKSLSPSAVMEFKKCPQSYLFQYLYGLKQPTNTALALGSMCHEALEKVFDLQTEERTLVHLQNLFRASWANARRTETYRHLFGTGPEHVNDWDKESEREWGQTGLKLLENYYHLEDPRLVERPNPIQREIWLRADLSVDPYYGGKTGYVGAKTTTVTNNNNTDTFHVRGIVDRLDMIRVNGGQQVALRIVDYKTGKAPNFKYSQAMNEKIAEEAFYQLKIYALLMREKGNVYANGLELRMLRLLFLTSEVGNGQYLDMDLGTTQEERDAVLNEIHVDLAHVWKNIQELVATQDPKAFVGCDRSFCYCHKCRTQFVSGTVWEG
jgi:RecB family exonuclease